MCIGGYCAAPVGIKCGIWEVFDRECNVQCM